MKRNSNAKRVALFRNNFLPYSETFIHDELRHHMRYEATVIARQHRNADHFPGHNVVAVEQIPERRRHLTSLWYSATARSSLIDKAMGNGRFDIAHAHFGYDGIYAMRYTRRHHIPLVVSLHGRDVTVLLGNDKYKPEWWYYLIGYRRLFKEASLFFAASTELKELITSVGCPARKVAVHRLGIDIDTFAPNPSSRETEPPLIVMVGRFVEKKGHEYGIRAAALAHDAGWQLKLVIVGDGPLRDRYESLARSLGIAENVEIPGPIPHSKVRDLLLKATCVLAPSVIARNLDRESGMIVAKEAAACGIPTIGTRHGGIPDIIEDGVTGYLVAERDSVALGERLSALLGDQNLRQSMGIAARKKMEREYDIRKRIIALEELYDAVIDKKW